jgi:ABC-type cobalamin/Fe3+-siderophores transport system ATPase subunit
MIGNKFHVLVAPNGFGKSSLAAAFRSLKPRSLKLSRDDFHARSEVLVPELELVISEDGMSAITQSAPPENHLLGFKVHHLRM